MSDNLGVPINRTYQSKVNQVNSFGIVAERIIRINPPVYQTRCSVCNAVTNISHERFDSAQCANTYLHNRGEINRSQITTTIAPSYAVRSRDSSNFRAYVAQEKQVTYSFRGEPTFQNADPSSIAAWLEQEGR